MSDRLYVYVNKWEDFQPRSDRPNLPWLRLHTNFLGNDAWLELSCPDTKLLICIWMLSQRYGNGRVKADERWLKSQAKAHKSSLHRLVDAGFLTLSTTKAAPNGGLEERSTTYSLEKKENAREDAVENGAPRRSKEDMQRLLEQAIAGGYQPEGIDA